MKNKLNTIHDLKPTTKLRWFQLDNCLWSWAIGINLKFETKSLLTVLIIAELQTNTGSSIGVERFINDH